MPKASGWQDLPSLVNDRSDHRSYRDNPRYTSIALGHRSYRDHATRSESRVLPLGATLDNLAGMPAWPVEEIGISQSITFYENVRDHIEATIETLRHSEGTEIGDPDSLPLIAGSGTKEGRALSPG